MIHPKVDELIRAVREARNELMETDEEGPDEILREKAIVDRADPAPPEEKLRLIKDGSARTANGKRSGKRVSAA